MPIPFTREVEYVDDGCSRYQCLSCMDVWEGRDSPEYGWKFCPYCGIQWEGHKKTRSHWMPKWRYEQLELPMHEENPDYERIRRIEEYAREVQERIRQELSCWLIQYKQEGSEQWHTENTIVPNDPTQPMAHKIWKWLKRSREEFDAERQGCILEYQKNRDEDLREGNLTQEESDDWCRKLWPSRLWRVRIVKRKDTRSYCPSYL